MHPTESASRSARPAPGAYLASDNIELAADGEPFISAADIERDKDIAAEAKARSAKIQRGRQLIAELDYESCVDLTHALFSRMETLVGGAKQ